MERKESFLKIVINGPFSAWSESVERQALLYGMEEENRVKIGITYLEGAKEVVHYASRFAFKLKKAFSIDGKSLNIEQITTQEDKWTAVEQEFKKIRKIKIAEKLRQYPKVELIEGKTEPVGYVSAYDLEVYVTHVDVDEFHFVRLDSDKDNIPVIIKEKARTSEFFPVCTTRNSHTVRWVTGVGAIHRWRVIKVDIARVKDEMSKSRNIVKTGRAGSSTSYSHSPYVPAKPLFVSHDGD